MTQRMQRVEIELGGGGAVAPDHLLVRQLIRHGTHSSRQGRTSEGPKPRLLGQRIESGIGEVEGDTHMVTRRTLSITLILALTSLLLLVSASLATAKGGPTMLEF